MNSKIYVAFDHDTKEEYLQIQLLRPQVWPSPDLADQHLQAFIERGEQSGFFIQYQSLVQNDGPENKPRLPQIRVNKNGFDENKSRYQNERDAINHVEYLRQQCLLYLRQPEDIKHCDTFFRGLDVKASLIALNPDPQITALEREFEFVNGSVNTLSYIKMHIETTEWGKFETCLLGETVITQFLGTNIEVKRIK